MKITTDLLTECRELGYILLGPALLDEPVTSEDKLWLDEEAKEAFALQLLLDDDAFLVAFDLPPLACLPLLVPLVFPARSVQFSFICALFLLTFLRFLLGKVFGWVFKGVSRENKFQNLKVEERRF